MQRTLPSAYSPPLRRPAAAARRGLRSWLGAILRLRRERKALAGLDPRLLDDIGVTPDEAQAEMQRPLWDVPQNWLR